MKYANRYTHDDAFLFEMDDYELDLQNEQDELEEACCLWQEADYVREEARRLADMELYEEADSLLDEWADLMDELDYYWRRLAA